MRLGYRVRHVGVGQFPRLIYPQQPVRRVSRGSKPCVGQLHSGILEGPVSYPCGRETTVSRDDAVDTPPTLGFTLPTFFIYLRTSTSEQ